MYKITDVALIPLASRNDADKAIVSAREHVRRRREAEGLGDEDYDSDSEDDAASVTDSLIDEPAAAPTEVKDPVTGQQGPVHGRDTSVAEDVMQHKGLYGRFADKWFSRKGWKTDSRRTQGLSSSDDLRRAAPKNVESTMPKEEEENPGTDSKPDAIPVDDVNVPEVVSPTDIPKALDGQTDSTTNALLPKILRTTKMYFSSGNFYFSYDYDLSRGVGQQEPSSSVPLYKQFDPLVSDHPFHCIIDILTVVVLLESEHYFPFQQCGPAQFRSAHHTGLCWTASIQHQSR